jgi:hypothetical protein
MSEPDLISAYVAAVRQALGAAPAARLLAEIREHLLESVASERERGLAPDEAAARALERFGPPEEVARQYAEELTAAAQERRARTLRAMAAPVVLLSLYYLRFFLAVRQETSTLLQIGILLVAALVLVGPATQVGDSAASLLRRVPDRLRGWTATGVAAGLGMACLAWADRDSHSVSDTLTRSVPMLCLIGSLALRVGSASLRWAPRPDGGR